MSKYCVPVSARGDISNSSLSAAAAAAAASVPSLRTESQKNKAARSERCVSCPMIVGRELYAWLDTIDDGRVRHPG